MFLHEEIAPERKASGYSIDLVKGNFAPLGTNQIELRYFAIKTPEGTVAAMEHFASFIPFDDQGTAVVKKLPATAISPGTLKAALDTTMYPGWTRDLKKDDANVNQEQPVTAFQPPTFGVTFLGTSHGFDEKGHTTGFIIWINGRGIVVDPPVYTTQYLQSHNIKRAMVDQVILTHCHSDHDSGILKKIVGGERLQLFTTKTIHESYKRKIIAATGLKFDAFYDFVPVPIGKAFKILGATFEFDYSLHAIPTLRFKLSFAGRSISYSSDTLYDPKELSELRNSGIISSEREMSLRMFVFDADLIIHESGVPPIHTPAAVLNDLPSSIKKKMVIVHCHYLPDKVEKQLPNGEKITVPITDLRIPKCGLENTISLAVTEFHEGYSLCSRRFRMLSDVFFFQKLSSSIVSELLTYLEEFCVIAGTTIIRSGELSDTFFVIENGEVNVIGGNDVQLNVLSAGDAFGENALRSSRQIPRSASVVARTNCHLLKVPASVFHAIVQKDHNVQEIRIDYDVSKVTKNRSFVAGVLARTYLFQNLPIEQINALAAVLEEEQRCSKDSILIRQGDRDTSLFIIKEGSVRLERTDEQGLPRVLIDHIGIGQVVGELALITALPRTSSVICNEDCVVIELRKPAFEHLLNKFQNINIKLSQLVEQRLKENQRIDEHLRTPRKALSASVLELSTGE